MQLESYSMNRIFLNKITIRLDFSKPAQKRLILSIQAGLERSLLLINLFFEYLGRFKPMA
jgi:hypothetical protein